MCVPFPWSLALPPWVPGLSFEKENKAWQAYFDNSEPHLMDLPGKWNIALNSFQKLIVLRALRPDRVSEALMNFVVEKMQQRYVEPPPFNLEACFADSFVHWRVTSAIALSI